MELTIIGLQIFADAGGGVAAGGAAPDAGGQNQQKGAENKELFVRRTAEEGNTPEEGSDREPEKTFDDILKENPKYKQEYDRRVKSIIDRRFKNGRAMEEENAKLKSIIPKMAFGYGVDENDVDGVIRACNDDKTVFNRMAAQKATSPETEEAAFMRDQEAKRRTQEADQKAAEYDELRRQLEEKRIFDRLDREVPELLKRYPGVDLRRETENPEFAELAMKYGVVDAYEFVHRRELRAAENDSVRKNAAAQVAGSVAANLARPSEGGLARASAPLVKIDPRTLTDEERQEIRRRLKRGEKISF